MPPDTSFLVNGFKPTIAAADPREVLAFKQQQQAGAQQLQEGALALQDKQRQIDQMKATNDAYRQAMTVGPDGSADIDTGALTKSLASSGHGSAIPGILEGVNKFKKGVADLA